MYRLAKPAVGEDEENSVKLELLHTFLLLGVLIQPS